MLTKTNYFVVRGARGSMSACGRCHDSFGGNTTCFSFHTPMGIIILDAGTGISSLSREIASLPSIPDVTFLFTHFHLDHVVGLPSFDPLYNAKAHITLMADPRRPSDWKETLKTFMGKPYWPIGLGEVNATMKMEDLPLEAGFLDLYGVRITWFRVPHPQQCLAFRLKAADADIVVATDVEYGKGHIAPAFIEFCRNTDFLIFDAHYRPEEYEDHRGWGHSTWEIAALAASEAGAGRLLLTHHAPERTDHEIKDIVRSTRRIFPATDAASEGMRLSRTAAS